MAKIKGRNTYQIQDLVKTVGVKEDRPTAKIGYIDWFKRGGWKHVTVAFGVVGLIGYVRRELKSSYKRESYMEAKMVMEQGIKPIEPANKNLFKDDKQHQFGQSMMKDYKLK